MKHLNEFEEFDPKDFEDFDKEQKELNDLGFKDRLEPGKDFGWYNPNGLDYLTEPPKEGSQILRVSQVGVDLLKKGDALLKSFSDRQIPFNDNPWSCGWNSYGKGGPKYQYKMSMFLLRRTGLRQGRGFQEYSLYGWSGDSGFGISGAKKIPKRSVEDINKQMFEKLKEFRVKIG